MAKEPSATTSITIWSAAPGIDQRLETTLANPRAMNGESTQTVKKYQQDSGIIMTTCMEHQTERTRGPSQQRNQRPSAQEVKERSLAPFPADHLTTLLELS